MRMSLRHSYLAAMAALAAVGAAMPAAAAARTAHPPAVSTSWTKISTTVIGGDSSGLFRTADGRLHVVWTRQDGGGSFSLHYSTVGGKAKLLGTGTILSGWAGLTFYPRLVAGPGGGIRLVFTGGNGQNGSPFNLDAMYTATSSSAGTSWTLVHGAMSQSKLVPETDDSAATQSNGTPVAMWPTGAANIDYHVGVDPNIPATSPDQTVPVNPGPAEGTALARNSDGSVWAGWYVESGQSNQGYWVKRILPSQASLTKAPGSGSTPGTNNHPLQPVAFTARAGGGLYYAYCVATSSLSCGHIALWRVGATSALTVPGSTTGHASRVAIAAAPHGHLWIGWYDTNLNQIKVVRTNAAATRFGSVTTLAAPPNTFETTGLQAEGSQGPLDVLALAAQNTSGLPFAYFDTQLLAKLALAGKPASVSHTTSTTVTFTVTDVGDPVSGATVSLLGKTATTNSSGIAKITVPKGTATGNHTATASKTGYAPATFTIKVT
jgi:hypothetical protein